MMMMMMMMILVVSGGLCYVVVWGILGGQSICTNKDIYIYIYAYDYIWTK